MSIKEQKVQEEYIYPYPICQEGKYNIWYENRVLMRKEVPSIPEICNKCRNELDQRYQAKKTDNR